MVIDLRYISSFRNKQKCRLSFRDQNVFKLERVINSWECCFSFLNRSIPLFPKEMIIFETKRTKLVKVETPFTDEYSDVAIVKILDKLMQSTLMLKLKFT